MPFLLLVSSAHRKDPRYVFSRSCDEIRTRGSLRENVTTRNTYINEKSFRLYFTFTAARARAHEILFLSKLSPDVKRSLTLYMNTLFFFSFRPIGRAGESQFFRDSSPKSFSTLAAVGFAKRRGNTNAGSSRCRYDLCPFNETTDKQFPSAVAIFSVKDRRDMCYLIDVSRIRGLPLIENVMSRGMMDLV